ncbi:MAG TPA: carbohydrate ABC transporter permease [Tepidisphaeraceae bacterium]|nr:carbohydrate ABC transporter permease [Tepidisphaeraceae bacterium]
MQAKKRPKILVHLALLIASAFALLPLIWMVSTSLKTAPQTAEYPPHLIPHPVAWKNYTMDLHTDNMNFALLARNTLIITLLSVAGTLISSAIVAYGFAKIRFPGRGILFAIMLSTMMIPASVTLVSLFAMYRWLDVHTPIQFFGTAKPLWLPYWFASAFNVFLLRQFYLTIPEELSEAARIDGCGEWGIFCRVILPLSRPALVVVALFTFMGVWNDFLGPLVYLQSPEQYTLAVGLENFLTRNGGAEYNLLMAWSVLIILPVLILFFVAQRTFVEGIATTGMKG